MEGAARPPPRGLKSLYRHKKTWPPWMHCQGSTYLWCVGNSTSIRAHSICSDTGRRSSSGADPRRLDTTSTYPVVLVVSATEKRCSQAAQPGTRTSGQAEAAQLFPSRSRDVAPDAATHAGPNAFFAECISFYQRITFWWCALVPCLLQATAPEEGSGLGHARSTRGVRVPTAAAPARVASCMCTPAAAHCRASAPAVTDLPWLPACQALLRARAEHASRSP